MEESIDMVIRVIPATEMQFAVVPDVYLVQDDGTQITQEDLTYIIDRTINQ